MMFSISANRFNVFGFIIFFISTFKLPNLLLVHQLSIKNLVISNTYDKRISQQLIIFANTTKKWTNGYIFFSLLLWLYQQKAVLLSTHTALFWHPYDVVLTFWTLYRRRNNVVCLLVKFLNFQFINRKPCPVKLL